MVPTPWSRVKDSHIHLGVACGTLLGVEVLTQGSVCAVSLDSVQQLSRVIHQFRLHHLQLYHQYSHLLRIFIQGGCFGDCFLHPHGW